MKFNKSIFLFLVFSYSFGTILNVPADFSTIQRAIDNSVDGDTVLVSDGDYLENLVIDKSIVLASNAIFNDLDDWVVTDEQLNNQLIVNNSHVLNTRIIGSNHDDIGCASFILIVHS